MTFQLDTTGAVLAPVINGWAQWPSPVLNVGEPMRWSDLPPFTKGYVEALFQSICPDEDGSREMRTPCFCDLAPEALAQIIADCEGFQKWNVHTHTGASFWEWRQKSAFKPFPPQTAQLCDNGKVRFTKATEESAS